MRSIAVSAAIWWPTESAPRAAQGCMVRTCFTSNLWKGGPMARRFLLVRDEDLSGMSGTGHVAEGIEFFDGTCVLHWMTEINSTGFYNNIGEVEYIHGHEGRTKVQWIDTGKAERERIAYRDALQRIAGSWNSGEGLNSAMHQALITLKEYNA